MQNLFNFENIYFEKIHFLGSAIKGKSYKVIIKEFTNGKQSDSSMLFDGAESDYFRVQSDSVSLEFAFQLLGDRLKAQVFGEGFGGKKVYLPLLRKGDEYAMKDFLVPRILCRFRRTRPMLSLPLLHQPFIQTGRALIVK